MDLDLEGLVVEGGGDVVGGEGAYSGESEVDLGDSAGLVIGEARDRLVDHLLLLFLLYLFLLLLIFFQLFLESGCLSL